MEKVDFKKQLKHLYRPSTRTVTTVDVPVMSYLMVDGEGAPEPDQAFGRAVEALFPLAYTLKFMVKKGDLGIDYGVMPLEGLFWADDMSAFIDGRTNEWKWTMMIMQPDFISTDMVAEATEQVARKKNPVALPLIRFETFTEGRCAQIMHIGPFSEEGPKIERVHAFIREQDCQLRGRHHEIYLSDIRRAAPEKWKTVIRQPMT